MDNPIYLEKYSNISIPTILPKDYTFSEEDIQKIKESIPSIYEQKYEVIFLPEHLKFAMENSQEVGPKVTGLLTFVDEDVFVEKYRGLNRLEKFYQIDETFSKKDLLDFCSRNGIMCEATNVGDNKIYLKLEWK